MGSENNEEKGDGWIPIRFSIRDGSSSSYQTRTTNFDHHGCGEHKRKSTLANQKSRSTWRSLRMCSDHKGGLPTKSPSLLWLEDQDTKIREGRVGITKDSRNNAKRKIRWKVGRTLQSERNPWKRNLPTDQCTKQKRCAVDLEYYVFEKVILIMNKRELYSFSLIRFCPFLSFSNKVFNEIATVDLLIENPNPM